MNIRRARRTTLNMLTIAGTLLGVTALSLGDEVIMRDGTVHNGKIVSQNRRVVTIDTEIHGISTRMELDRRRIKSIVISDDPLPTPSDASPSDTPSIPTIGGDDKEDERKVLKRDGYNLVLEVPLKGTFGQDIYPLGVANALEYAKEVGVTDVVFRINSPGGEVWAATDMVDIMKEYKGEFKMHMLIESAISASIWPTFNCDTITMAPGSDFGGAVVYTRNSTGSTEVDKKMNSILSSKLESMADANGHSEYLVRAMILSEAAVYAYEGPDGEWIVTDTTDGIPGEYEVIDSPDTVLTLTAKQAVKFGLVHGLEDGNSLDEFAQIHGIEKWDNAGQFGYETVEKDVEKCKRVRDRLEATITGFYREASILGDRNYIQTYGSSLQTMRRHIGQYKRLMRDADEMHMPSIIDAFEQAIDTTFWESEIETRMAELRRLRRGP